MVIRSTPVSIVQLISLTLGAVGVVGCSTDGIPDGSTTTVASSGMGSESDAGESGTDSMDASTDGTGSSTDTTDTTDPTGPSTDGTDPCAGLEPIITPFDIADWVVDSVAYDGMRAAAELYSGLPWDMRDDAERCLIACAYATNNVDTFNPYDIYLELSVVACELTIPTLDADGLITCSGERIEEQLCPGGRAPLAWTLGDAGEVMTQLDAMTTMEAVSVTAFEELAAQLERLAAPADLVARCRAAARDEVQHRALLEQLGGRGPATLPTPAPAETSALAIALHNAVEGCVSETWAALLARHQSEHASDPHARRAFAEIAEDEARHAQLAWDLHDWLLDRLEPAEAAQVEAARLVALGQLERVASQQALAVAQATRAQLGLPDPRHAQALARAFGARLRAAAA